VGEKDNLSMSVAGGEAYCVDQEGKKGKAELVSLHHESKGKNAVTGDRVRRKIAWHSEKKPKSDEEDENSSSPFEKRKKI